MISILKKTPGPETKFGKSRTKRVAASEKTQPSPSEILDQMEHWIGCHPALCVGLAMAVGVTIGCLVKRR